MMSVSRTLLSDFVLVSFYLQMQSLNTSDFRGSQVWQHNEDDEDSYP